MRLLFIIFFSLMIYHPCYASIPQVEEKIDFDIQNQWRVFNQTASTSKELGLGILSGLYDFQIQHKIDALTIPSTLLLSKINPLDGEMEKDPYWTYAKRFDPFSPNPHYAICQLDTQASLLSKAPHCIQGLILEWKSMEGRLFLKAFFSHILCGTLLISIFVVFGLFLIKYLGFFLQYASARFVWLSPFACGGLLLITVTTLSLSFGWVFGLIFLSWVLWKFLDRFERYTLFLIYICIALIPLTYTAPATYIQWKAQSYQSIPPFYAHQSTLEFKENKVPKEQLEASRFSKTMFQKTFYQTNFVQLYISLLFGLIVALLLGMFNHVGDIYFVYKKKAAYAKKLILKDLQAYPKLYFDFVKKLQRQDWMGSLGYNLVPFSYFFHNGKPLKSFIYTLLTVFLINGLYVSTIHLTHLHFPWHWIFFSLALGVLAPLWIIEKPQPNREYYDKNTPSKK